MTHFHIPTNLWIIFWSLYETNIRICQIIKMWIRFYEEFNPNVCKLVQNVPSHEPLSDSSEKKDGKKTTRALCILFWENRGCKKGYYFFRNSILSMTTFWFDLTHENWNYFSMFFHYIHLGLQFQTWNAWYAMFCKVFRIHKL